MHKTLIAFLLIILCLPLVSGLVAVTSTYEISNSHLGVTEESGETATYESIGTLTHQGGSSSEFVTVTYEGNTDWFAEELPVSTVTDTVRSSSSRTPTGYVIISPSDVASDENLKLGFYIAMVLFGIGFVVFIGYLIVKKR